MSRRLILLFDGTWNRRENATNVWRMRLLLDRADDQLIYYDEGVGTQQLEKIRGGALGTGLSAKVLDGYLWLMENYRPAEESASGRADDIYVFGFSRGAFTARSLVGLLSLCGLVRKEAPVSVLSAFETSRLEGVSRNTKALRRFRQGHSIEIRIKFLGVWDTVGALGIHKLDVPFLERYQYHKISDVDIVDHVRHALALDEHRKVFDATLFPAAKPGQTLEQRWFAGSHANVGGGYDQDGLFQRPMQWMITEATKYGLLFKAHSKTISGAFYRSTVINSLQESLLGAYYLTQWFKRYDRPVTLTGPNAQTLDYTVIQRWLWQNSYDPPSLRLLLGTKPKTRSRMFRLPVDEICAAVPKLRLSSDPNHDDALTL